MAELVPCKHCGKIPVMDRSHSSRMIHHICDEQRISWNSKSEVERMWNENNSQVENKKALIDTPSPKFPSLVEFHRAVSVECCYNTEEMCPDAIKEAYNIMVRIVGS